MKSLIDNVTASIIAVILSTFVGLILQALGSSTQISITLSLIFLVVLFLTIRLCYPIFVRWLTLMLVKQAMSVNLKNSDKTGCHPEFWLFRTLRAKLWHKGGLISLSLLWERIFYKDVLLVGSRSTESAGEPEFCVKMSSKQGGKETRVEQRT